MDRQMKKPIKVIFAGMDVTDALKHQKAFIEAKTDDEKDEHFEKAQKSILEAMMKRYCPESSESG